jgi:glycosidase
MRASAPFLSAAVLLFAAISASSAPPPATNPEWAPGAVLYEAGDGKGGLQGLLARLDSLNDGNPHSFGDLGVDVLYLPHTPHAITGPDLAPLRAAAEKRGMKVIVDAGGPGGGSLPKKVDAPLAAAIVQGVKEGQAGGIVTQLAELVRRSPQGAGETPYLTHQAYPLDGLGREKSAAAVLLTLPGAPFLSDGEELGLPGEKATVAAETSDPDSLLSYYRFLIRARHNSEALRQGSLVLLTPANAATPILAFLRQTAGETVLVVHNLGDTAVEAGPYAVPGTPDPFYVSPGVPPLHGSSGAWKVKLPPHASGIWRMRVR